MVAIKDSLTVVIVLDHARVTGGQAKVAFDSALGLKRRGHQPIIFAAAGPVDPILAESGIRTVCLGQTDLIGNPSKLDAAVKGLWNGAAARALGDLLAECPRGRTIVHVHGWAKALSPAIAGPIAKSGLPAILTMHEYFLLCPNGGFFNYQQQHACGLEPLSAKCWASHCDSRSYARKLWRGARQVVVKHAADLPGVFSDIICISQFQLDKIGHRLPPHARIHRVSNPIEAVPLGPKADASGGPIIFLGRISPEKGPFLFAEAARRAGLPATFVGDGPAAAQLKARYPEASILGWQNPEEVRHHLRAASALVFPSLWYEGQPLVVLEAKAMGTPVIVSDGCAGREAITDGMDGIWFRSGDADDLARALTEFRAGDIDAMATAAYASFWSDPPSIDRHVDAISAIYADLLHHAVDGRAAIIPPMVGWPEARRSSAPA